MSKPQETIPLRRAIAERFADTALSPEQLAQLKALTDVASSAAPDRPARPDRRRWLAAAAVLAVGAGVGAWLRQGAGTDNLQRLADEIAYNHLSGKLLDVQGDSIAALRPAFASLGFALLDAPADPELQGATLLGGRFCSIASVPAALLRYRRADGQEVTLYQAPFDPVRHRDAPDMRVAAAPAVVHARGLRVSLCHLQGVFMAVAA